MKSDDNSYRELILDNGLFVALQNTPTKTVSGRLRVHHGALHEQRGEEGLAHFLEHTIMTGGSRKYNPERADEISGTFGSFNAYTSLDITSFPVDMLSEDTSLFLEYISDAVFNPRFDASRVEEERQRVLRETADTKSNPGFKDGRAYSKAFFGDDSPYTYFILGNEAVVGSASIEKLGAFHKRGYHPNNMDLILVGALPSDIEDLIEKNFGSFPRGDSNKIRFLRNPQLSETKILHTSAPELLNHESPEESSAHLSIGLVGPVETDEDSYAVDMLVKILGRDASSRLFTNVSQRKGLAYGVSADYDVSNNKGAIYISGSVHALKADAAIDAIFEELGRLQTHLVSQDDLERLKRISRYRIAKVFESNSGHVGAIETKLDFGLTPELHLEKIDQVTPEKVREAANRYLSPHRESGKYVLLLRDPLKR